MSEVDLWELLPSAYKIDDAAKGYPLRAMLNIVSQQANLVKDNIGTLWDDFFIETCAEWAIPYIGDLVGSRPIFPVLRGPRADVARTIYFRRRKGTLPMLEELARYVTGWSAHAVAFFELMSWTQHMNHLRPQVGTIELRDLNALDRVQTAFDRFAHSADLRPISHDEGWHGISKVGFFLWRLTGYRLETVTPRQSLGHPYGYHFSPLGAPAPLFQRAERETDEAGLANELNVDGPIRPTAIYSRITDYYPPTPASGAPDGISIFRDGTLASRVAPDRIICMNLRDWTQPPADHVGIDVTLGRISFGANMKPAAPAAARVSFSYGFSADIGGGPYARPGLTPRGRDTGAALPVTVTAINSLGSALAVLPPDKEIILVIPSSRTYNQSLSLGRAGGSLTIQAEDGRRPLLVGDVEIPVVAPTHLVLDGLLIEGQLRVAANSSLRRLELRDCTLIPGRALDETGAPADPTAPSLVVGVGNPELEIRLERCITGPLLVPASVASLALADSILDSPGKAMAHLLPVLVGGPIALPLTSTGVALTLTVDDLLPVTVSLTGSFTTRATARDSLERAIRSSSPHPAFANAEVLLLDNRLVLLPGVPAAVSVTPATVGGATDPLADTLRLTPAQGARQAFALIGAALAAGLPDVARSLSVTLEPAEPGDAATTLAITLPPLGGTTVTASNLAGQLRPLVRAGAGAAFASAMVGATDKRLVIIPGDNATLPLIHAPADLGLNVARPVIAADLAGVAPGPPTTLERVTVFGTIYVSELTLASETIFTAPVVAQRRQSGCVRFSYLPAESQTPRRYRCQPDLALEEHPGVATRSILARLTPAFTARRYGQPAYAQLALGTAPELAAGAENGAEMGVFNLLLQPQREANLRIRLEEYLPFGLEPGIIYVT